MIKAFRMLSKAYIGLRSQGFGRFTAAVNCIWVAAFAALDPEQRHSADSEE